MFDRVFSIRKITNQEKKIKYYIENTKSVKDIRGLILDKVFQENPKIVLTKRLAEKIHKQAIKDAELQRLNKLKSKRS
jgi:hypothetical protein